MYIHINTNPWSSKPTHRMVLRGQAFSKSLKLFGCFSSKGRRELREFFERNAIGVDHPSSKLSQLIIESGQSWHNSIQILKVRRIREVWNCFDVHLCSAAFRGYFEDMNLTEDWGMWNGYSALYLQLVRHSKPRNVRWKGILYTQQVHIGFNGCVCKCGIAPNEWI